MKTRTFLILLAVFFGFTLWLGRISSATERWPERVDVSFAVSMTMLAAGGLIAAVSLFALLQRGLGGQSLDRTLPLILALLGGLLLYQVNWGVALALGMIGTATIVFQHWNGPKPPPKG
ncbi:MAG: hypothetical protein ABSA69_06275 [Verrucomicrobiota bacterium]|jgi:uncharacterized membrane protein AbrB (regulator of aidB expression)